MIGPELFKQIPDAQAYWVSASGRVMKRVNVSHPERHQWIDIKQEDVKGTMRVRTNKKQTVARLVYSLFVGNLKDGMVICHLNGNYRDNRWQNLYQGSQLENISHKRLHGTWQSCEKHPRATMSNEFAIKVKKTIDEYKDKNTGRLKKGAGPVIAKMHGVSLHVIHSLSRNVRKTYGDLFS